jgi:hypothetical protein
MPTRLCQSTCGVVRQLVMNAAARNKMASDKTLAARFAFMALM